MSFLVGQQGTGWTIVAANIFASAGNATYARAGYTAASSGTMGTAHVTVQSVSTATAAEIYVYAGAKPGTTTFVAKSGTIDVSSAGDKTAAITGSITSGSVYTLVVQTSAGRFNAAVNSGTGAADNQNTSANVTYDAPPTNLPAPDTQTGQEFIIWIDGTTLGSGQVPNMDYEYQSQVAQ